MRRQKRFKGLEWRLMRCEPERRLCGIKGPEPLGLNGGIVIQSSFMPRQAKDEGEIK